MILALAGRRIDASDASVARFPAANIQQVSKAVQALLKEKKVATLVSSAACGADLISLAEAGKSNLRRRVILPFDRQRFRKKSVIDRPGDWGELYDCILDDVSAKGDLVIMDNAGGAEPFIAASQEVLNEAIRIGHEAGATVGAAIIWDGTERGAPDYTAEFANEARRRGLEIFEIRTL
jgi:hypothetical protein